MVARFVKFLLHRLPIGKARVMTARNLRHERVTSRRRPRRIAPAGNEWGGVSGGGGSGKSIFQCHALPMGHSPAPLPSTLPGQSRARNPFRPDGGPPIARAVAGIPEKSGAFAQWSVPFQGREFEAARLRQVFTVFNADRQDQCQPLAPQDRVAAYVPRGRLRSCERWFGKDHGDSPDVRRSRCGTRKSGEIRRYCFVVYRVLCKVWPTRGQSISLEGRLNG